MRSWLDASRPGLDASRPDRGSQTGCGCMSLVTSTVAQICLMRCFTGWPRSCRALSKSGRAFRLSWNTLDRGPDSSGVLDRLIRLCGAYQATCLKGNHEALLLQFLADPHSLEGWARIGGLNTLKSYGWCPPSTKPCGVS